MRLILASGSPRRREILAKLGYEFEIAVSHTDETYHSGEPCEIAREIALAKARTVADLNPDAVVLGADTAVWLDGEMLGKPVDGRDAKRMLRALSGRSHEVITGIAAVRGGREATDVCVTEVVFGEWSDAEIDAYIATGSPLDKAGGYGIQELPSRLALARGDLDNVIGLPSCGVDRLLKTFTEKQI